MGLYLGSTDISGASFYLGSNAVSKLYLGSTELTPPPYVTTDLIQYIDPFASTIGGGQATDLSGNANNAILGNSIAVTGTNDGTGGWQLNAQGASAKYLNLGLDTYDYTDGISMEIWFYVAAGSTYDSEPGIMLYRDVSGTTMVAGFNQATTTTGYQRGIAQVNASFDYTENTTSMIDGAWHHWVYTYSNGAGGTLYKDGVSIDTHGAVGNVSISGQPLIAGGPVGGSGGIDFYRGFSNALMGLTRLYNKVLSASEVTQNYDANKADYGIHPPSSTMWRYDVGATTSHHPRVSRIDLYDEITGTWQNLITYAADNCADTGGIPCGDTGYCDTSGVIDKTFGSAISVTGCRFYVSYGGGYRSANIQILRSPDGGANYYPVWNSLAAASSCGEVELTLTPA